MLTWYRVGTSLHSDIGVEPKMFPRNPLRALRYNFSVSLRHRCCCGRWSTRWVILHHLPVRFLTNPQRQLFESFVFRCDFGLCRTINICRGLYQFYPVGVGWRSLVRAILLLPVLIGSLGTELFYNLKGEAPGNNGPFGKMFVSWEGEFIVKGVRLSTLRKQDRKTEFCSYQHQK